MWKRRRSCLLLETLESRAMASDTLVGVVYSLRGGSAPAPALWTPAAPSAAPVFVTQGATAPARPAAGVADYGKMTNQAVYTAGRPAPDRAPGAVAGSEALFGDLSWAWPGDLTLDLSHPSMARGGLTGAGSSVVVHSPANDLGSAAPSTAPDARGALVVSQPSPDPRPSPAAAAALPAAALDIETLPPNGDTHQPPPPPFRGSGFHVSWYSGAYDSSNRFMGATEVMQLVPYKGMLFAGTSSWADVPGRDPVVGAEILRLDGPHARWQVDADFTELLPNGQPRFVRVGAMNAFTFTHDGNGNALPEPVSMLLAVPSDQLGVDAVYSRNDDTGTWTPMVLAESPVPGGIRALGFYRDSVTGLERVFAGSAAAGLFSGVYDAKAPGRVRWEPVPELVPYNRFMAFAEADGAFYTVVQPAMYRRVDGAQPSWDTVYTYPPPPVWASGLRGLTTIANPTGPGDALITGKEGLIADVLRFDPNVGFRPVIELYAQNFLRQRWGPGYSLSDNYVVLSYNDIPQYVDPRTGETVQLVTLFAQSPNPGQANSAWFFIRHANAQYDLREVPPLPTPNNPHPALRATRSIVVSPFPEDRGRVFYLAGYDVSEMPSHNTGWIYRASLKAVLGGSGGGQSSDDTSP